MDGGNTDNDERIHDYGMNVAHLMDVVFRKAVGATFEVLTEGAELDEEELSSEELSGSELVLDSSESELDSNSVDSSESDPDNNLLGTVCGMGFV